MEKKGKKNFDMLLLENIISDIEPNASISSFS